MSASAEFKEAAQQEVVRPVYLVRVLEIPPVNPATHETDYLYLTDAETNVTWFDAEHKPLKEGVTALFLSNEILSIRFVNETVRLDWNRSYYPEENSQERDSFHPA